MFTTKRWSTEVSVSATPGKVVLKVRGKESRMEPKDARIFAELLTAMAETAEVMS